MSELLLPVRYYRHHTDPGVPCVEANFQYAQHTLHIPTDQAALVLVDVWDVHPVASHLARTDEITRTRIVPVVRAARQAGVTIVHARSPSVAQKDAQSTRYAQAARREPAATNWPPPQFIDRAGEYAQYARPAEPMMDLWQERLAARRIQADVEPEPDDFVVATGDQLQRLLEDRRLLHLFYVGFATNICVPFRDYGMRAFRKRGYNPILLRDCTTAIEAHDTVDDLLITKLAIRDFEMMDVAWPATAEDFRGACAQ